MPRDLKIEHVAVSDLVPYARNPRTHSDEQVEVIAASIERFGWTNPVLIGNDSEVIAGHGRLMAAKRLGLKVVPVLRIGDLSPDEQRAYVIADNQTALRAGWDLDILRLELTELKGMDFDLGPLGFDDAELAAILDGATATAQSGAGSLAERFGVPPFSVLNAREGWWQERKRAWISLGIQSELGRGDTGTNSPHEGKGMSDGLVAVRAAQKARKANATPGGSLRPAADYSKRQRGNGKGQAID